MNLWLSVAGEGLGGKIKGFLATVHGVALGLGGPGLFLLALADSSFVSIPEGNDVLIVILSSGETWSKMLYFVGMTTAGSVVGCSILYAVGRRGGDFVEKRMQARRIARVRALYDRWGILAVMIPSILPPPTPFKIFVLSAGVFQLPFWRFLVAVAVGRSFRYLMWGVLAVLYGVWARQLLEEHIQTVGLVLGLIFVALGVWLFVRYRGRDAQEEAA